MSREVEKSDLTAGGDAPPVEAIKIDRIDNTVAIVAVKNTDAMPEDAAAGEVAKEVSSAQGEDERSLEATNDADVPVGDGVANLEPRTAEITNIVTKIVPAPAGDVVQAETQESAGESNSFAVALQSEETSKSANEEKVRK